MFFIDGFLIVLAGPVIFLKCHVLSVRCRKLTISHFSPVSMVTRKHLFKMLIIYRDRYYDSTCHVSLF